MTKPRKEELLMRKQQSNLKGRTFANLAFDGDVSAMCLSNPSADGETQSASTGLARARRVGLVEALEDVWNIVRSDAYSAVANLRNYKIILRFQPQIHVAAGGRVLYGIL